MNSESVYFLLHKQNQKIRKQVEIKSKKVENSGWDRNPWTARGRDTPDRSAWSMDPLGWTYKWES